MSQIHDLFLDAHELPSPEERRAFLDRECADRPDLRREVEALLAAADQADAWFGEENGGVEDGGGRERPDFRLETARAEDRIGRYRLLEQIGEAGFGVVWKAEQEYPVRRSVAVKIIKAGMDTREVVARFEQERQALAMMNHPHIAQVLEAGATESGRPYFAMELVSGVPVTEFCDERHLTVEERLALFREICLAIQHAHRKGIIHRDIKPSNILTAMVDGRPAPKVIDFGIAKATQQPLTDATLLTSFEQFIGTPEYMSPEQAAGGMTNIDTRSDIYSLGVLLYELLTGGPPFARKTLAGAGHQEIRRIICEEEAPKPSARLGAIREEEGARVAAARRTEPDRLRRRVRGDLDWIVMRALEKDRDRRYESASDLAMDVHSFLEHRPVKAGPPSAGYVLRKFARRHRVAITASVSVAAALVAGLTVSLWMFLHEKAARERAVAAELTAARRLAESETARREARTVSGFLLDLLRSPYPADKGPPVTIRQVLDKAGKDLPTVFRDMPEDRAVMEEALAMSYDTIGSSGMAIPLLASASEYVRRHPSHGPESELSRRLQARLALLHSRAGKPHLAIPRMEACLKWEQRLDSGSLMTIQRMIDLAECHFAAGSGEEAAALLEQALPLARGGPSPEHREETVRCLTQLTRVRVRLGRHAPALEAALEGLNTAGAGAAANASADGLLENLIRIRVAQGQLPEAEAAAAELRALREKLNGGSDYYTLAAVRELGNIRNARGHTDDAIRLWQTAAFDLKDDTLKFTLGGALLGQARYREALTALRSIDQGKLRPEATAEMSRMIRAAEEELAKEKTSVPSPDGASSPPNPAHGSP